METQTQVEQPVALAQDDVQVVDVTKDTKLKTEALKFWKAIEVTFKDQKGVFVIKRLPIGDQIKRDLMIEKLDRSAGVTAALLQEGGADALSPAQQAHRLHTAMATVFFAVAEAPAWWPSSLEEVYEYDILVAIYSEVATFQSTFR